MRKKCEQLKPLSVIPGLQDKVAKLHEKAQEEQKSFNESLLACPAFHNPYLIERLAALRGLQSGTNFPPPVHDISPSDFFELLAVEQKHFQEERRKAKKSRTIVEFEEAAAPMLFTTSDALFYGEGASNLNFWVPKPEVGLEIMQEVGSIR
eukprot:gb/GEZN01020826.1/.p1 GENE.gb/GEZN01020826.1/~~gb/GEZN01020826.1/.p1  ORF type:complete len:151 (+),score=25.58 gb/GEZN01020826.1/:92-544(+)